MESELIRILIKEQQPDGSFFSYSSSDPDFKRYILRKSTFTTSLILCALEDIHQATITKVKQKAVDYILSNKSDNWTWNYWDRNSSEYHTIPYPDDADDTFCALSALYEYNPQLLNGTALARITEGLTDIEVHEGGPYYTWYTANKKWKDIDLAVNANIRFFLGKMDIILPHLEKLICKGILDSSATSRYYPTAGPIYYFITRAAPSLPPHVIDSLINQLRTYACCGTIDQICISSAFHRLGIKTELMKNIATIQKLSPFCFDPVFDGSQYYASSPALQAALALEALCLQQPASINITQTHEVDITSVVTSTQKRLKNSSDVLARTIDKVSRGSQKESILLPYHTYKLLKQTKIPLDTVHMLCEAQLLGWIAYTLYDDILDGDAPASVLGYANICLRELTHIYMTLTPKTFHPTFSTLMNLIDMENIWEAENCRSVENPPTYSPQTRIAHKSIGHALGSLALVHMNNTKDHKSSQHLYTFFIHYITARQLGDDAHDWEEDLKRNRVSPVIAQLVLSKGFTHQNAAEMYWKEIVAQICVEIRYHINQAHEALSKVTCFSSSGIFEHMLGSLTEMVTTTETEQRNALQFLAHIQKAAKS